MKIYELAKELGVDNKAIIDFLVKSGVEVKSHMSSISDENADKVRAKFAPKKEVKGVKAVPVNIPASASAKKPEVKAVALPDHIIKKVEEENKASQTTSESKSADSQSQAKSDDASADVKKKKKIVAAMMKLAQ